MVLRRASWRRLAEQPSALQARDARGRVSRVGGAEGVEAAVEVFDQVLRVFEADMEAQGRAFGLEAGRAANARGRGGLDQALEPPPPFAPSFPQILGYTVRPMPTRSHVGLAPRIEHRYARPPKIARVARDDRQAVIKRSRGDNQIGL